MIRFTFIRAWREFGWKATILRSTTLMRVREVAARSVRAQSVQGVGQRSEWRPGRAAKRRSEIGRTMAMTAAVRVYRIFARPRSKAGQA